MSETGLIDESLERRATIRLLHYWRSLPRAASPPAMSLFDPRRNPVPWERCFVVTAGDQPDQIEIEHLGSGLFAMLEQPVPEKVDIARLPALIGLLIGDLGRVLTTAEPVQRDGAEPLAQRAIIQYRSILLPFTDHLRRPRYGLGAVTMRIMPVGSGGAG